MLHKDLRTLIGPSIRPEGTPRHGQHGGPSWANLDTNSKEPTRGGRVSGEQGRGEDSRSSMSWKARQTSTWPVILSLDKTLMASQRSQEHGGS